jgi:DNA-binding Xre family transcriptional regulator
MTKIKQLLSDKSMSQKDLYNAIDERCITPIGYDRISKIVNGKICNYSMFTLLKFCIALDCTPNDVIDKETFIEKECK